MAPGTPHIPNEGGGQHRKSRGEKVAPAPLASAEWDFRRVPEAETLACALYEHARECVRALPELQRRLTTLARVESAPKGAAIRRTRFTASRAIYELIHTPLGTPYSRADMASVAWSQLTDEERALAVALITPDEAPSSLKPGDEIPGTFPPIRYNPPKRGGRGISFAAVMRDGKKFPGAPEFSDFFGAETALSLVMGLPTDALEFGFFAVDWNHTNEQLRYALLDWLDREIEKRPTRKAAYSRQGKDKDNAPVGWLNALGAMRLLRSGLTLEKARTFSAENSPHKTPLFQDLADWSRARKHTFPDVMRVLFGARAVWVKQP